MSSFPGGFGMFFHASSILANSFFLKTYSFYCSAIKSLTTKIISFGFYEPKSLRLSSKMTSRICSWDPLYNPSCWTKRLTSKVFETARANKEFCLSVFWIKKLLLFFISARLNHCPQHQGLSSWLECQDCTRYLS